jgi:pimeloyl-ACP methyl ester carboxylesterase
VGGAPRRLLLEMNGIALRAPDPGEEREAPSAVERLGGLRPPALVVLGDLDLPSVQERGRQIAEEAPGGQLTVLANTAHLPQLERPAQVAAAIGVFLVAAGA